MTHSEIDVAVDNDVILKAVSYELVAEFWPTPDRIGILGAARYVLSNALRRRGYPREIEEALLRRLEALADSANVLEPAGAELEFAANLELVAQKLNLDLDSGETQLAAIVVERAITALETGDKRAIAALEVLLGRESRLGALVGRVRYLEQIILRVLGEHDFERVRTAICDRPDADKTLAICFACSSEGGSAEDSVIEALNSYIADLRTKAQRVLCDSL